MKRLTLLFTLALVGCSGVSNSGNNGNSTTTTGTSNTPTVTGSWSGNLVGTNFTGTVGIDTSLTQTSSGSLTGSILAPTGDCPISAQLSGQITSSSVSLSSTAGTFVVIQATLGDNGQQLTGNISFAAGQCGTSSNPWTGTINQAKQ